jgi:hypothetical protein
MTETITLSLIYSSYPPCFSYFLLSTLMRLLSLICMLIAPLFLVSLPSYAVCDATTSQPAGNFLRDCAGFANAVSPSQLGGGVTSIQKLVISVAKQVIAFGALFAIGALVFTGIQYTISYGDDEKVKKAKTTGIYALI